MTSYRDAASMEKIETSMYNKQNHKIFFQDSNNIQTKEKCEWQGAVSENLAPAQK